MRTPVRACETWWRFVDSSTGHLMVSGRGKWACGQQPAEGGVWLMWVSLGYELGDTRHTTHWVTDIRSTQQTIDAKWWNSMPLPTLTKQKWKVFSCIFWCKKIFQCSSDAKVKLCKCRYLSKVTFHFSLIFPPSEAPCFIYCCLDVTWQLSPAGVSTVSCLTPGLDPNTRRV